MRFIIPPKVLPREKGILHAIEKFSKDSPEPRNGDCRENELQKEEN